MPVPHTANMDNAPGLHHAHIPPPPAGYPTLGFVAPNSGSTGNTAHAANDSLTTTNLCATPQSFYSGIGASAGTPPMAASARVVTPTGPKQPTVAELKKTQSKLPSLHFNSKIPFQLVKTWKEWTVAVRFSVSNRNEHAPFYWKSMVDRATALYGQCCPTSSNDKAAVETTDQPGMAAQEYNTLIASTNSIELVLRQALTEALPQGNTMLQFGIYTTERMLFYTMRKNLPTKNFLKIAVIDAVETRLTEPKSLPECVAKLRTYIHDIQIAFGILHAFGPSQQNVHVNPIKVCAVMRAFADHVRTVYSYLAAKIVMMGQPSENLPIQQLVQYAVQLLGIMAERVSEEKSTKQIFSHTAGPTTKDKPQANATRGKAAGNSKKGKDDPKPPNKPVTCNYMSCVF
eukprot:5920401-Amphidinium_carterae.1